MTVPKPPPIGVRGIRQTLPPGYLIGRAGSVSGPAQLISMADLGTSIVTQVETATAASAATYEYLGFFGQGPFSAHEQIQLPVLPTQVTFPSASALTAKNKAWCLQAPTSSFMLALTNNLAAYLASGTNVLCFVAFVAGQKTGSFAYGNPVTLAAQTQLWLVMPATADATMSGLYLQFAGDP